MRCWSTSPDSGYELHDVPHDYYRFSEYTYREVILRELKLLKVEAVMTPPRIISLARKPPDRAGGGIAGDELIGSEVG